MRGEIKPGDTLEVIMDDFLPGNDVKPPLSKGETKEALAVFKCECGEHHIDVGLTSHYNFISCIKCAEPLPNGDQTHWCHDSRFIIISNPKENSF